MNETLVKNVTTAIHGLNPYSLLEPKAHLFKYPVSLLSLFQAVIPCVNE